MFYKKLLATTALTITMASSVIAQDVTLSSIDVVDAAEWDYDEALEYKEAFRNVIDVELKGIGYDRIVLNKKKVQDVKQDVLVSDLKEVDEDTFRLISSIPSSVKQTARGGKTFPDTYIAGDYKDEANNIIRYVDLDKDGEDEILWIYRFEDSPNPVPVTLFDNDIGVIKNGYMLNALKMNEDGEYVKVLQEVIPFAADQIGNLTIQFPNEETDYAMLMLQDQRKSVGRGPDGRPTYITEWLMFEETDFVYDSMSYLNKLLQDIRSSEIPAEISELVWSPKIVTANTTAHPKYTHLEALKAGNKWNANGPYEIGSLPYMTLDYKELPAFVVTPDMDGQLITPAFLRGKNTRLGSSKNDANKDIGLEFYTNGFSDEIPYAPYKMFKLNSQTHQDWAEDGVGYRIAGGTGKMKIKLDEKTKIRVGIRDVAFNGKGNYKAPCNLNISVKGRDLLNSQGYGGIKSVVRTFPAGEFPIEIKETCDFADKLVEDSHNPVYNNGKYSMHTWAGGKEDYQRWALGYHEIFFELDDGAQVIADGADMASQGEGQRIARGTPLPRYYEGLLEERSEDAPEITKAAVLHSVNGKGVPKKPAIIDFTKPVNVGALADLYEKHKLKPNVGKQTTAIKFRYMPTEVGLHEFGVAINSNIMHYQSGGGQTAAGWTYPDDIYTSPHLWLNAAIRKKINVDDKYNYFGYKVNNVTTADSDAARFYRSTNFRYLTVYPVTAINIQSENGMTEFGTGDEGKEFHWDFTDKPYKSVYASFYATEEDVQNGVEVNIMSGFDTSYTATMDGYISVSDKFGVTGEDVKEENFASHAEIEKVMRYQTKGMAPQKASSMQRAGVPLTVDFTVGVRKPSQKYFWPVSGVDLANQGDLMKVAKEVVYTTGVTGPAAGPVGEDDDSWLD